ncbi:sugar phosphate isomerase/epimerase [Paenibacillus sp. LHD-38]|uniref:sugar phosphate isomerase/epimerase family protein n=1 Tax=Paenibacillus sp. LHD-38 TaxID=3072143 RepID=UPI00280E40BD|nr:sugar phosphate isomerase/epimerase [Paenibacillus sp. LHD-38]MDQ8738804.1 sugar phosphate isomerase/epimerase [Paenibacillus sp. LHD-38]
MTFAIGLQPWTIRAELDIDFFGSLEKAATIGYQGVEVGMPPSGTTPQEFKAHLDRIGLRAISIHSGMDDLKNELDSLLDYATTIESKYIALSYTPFKSSQEIKDVAGQLNRIGDRCRERGIQLLYHNHDWEFLDFNGTSAYDLLLQETDPALVQMELDVYWVAKGGEDPIRYLRLLKGRCPLLHVKDMEPGEERFFAEVGAGILPMSQIIEAAADAGTEWLIVEQDECRRPPFDSIATSFRNLKSMGVVV